MTTYQVSLPECMSYGNDFIILEKLSDNLSHEIYDGGGYTALVRLTVSIIGSCKIHGLFEEYMSCVLFIYTLQGHLTHWCATLPKKYIDSLVHLVREIDRTFNHFDHEALDQEILKLLKSLDESVDQFYIRFIIFHTDFLKMKFIGNFFMEDFSILFTYPNPTQHTLVMELRKHRKVQSLSQVTIHLHPIKQLHHRGAMWEIMHMPLLNYHTLPPHLLLRFAQIWLAGLLVVTWTLSLDLHPYILLIL